MIESALQQALYHVAYLRHRNIEPHRAVVQGIHVAHAFRSFRLDFNELLASSPDVIGGGYFAAPD
jgi:hypothetical protein